MDQPDFTFVLPGQPVPWQRAQRDGRTGRTFTSDRNASAKHDVAVVGGAKMRSRGVKMAPKGTPVLIRLDAYFQMPKKSSITKKEWNARLARKYHTVKPDGDNLIKLVKDALNGIVWHDDCQVQLDGVNKWWSEAPSRTVVVIKILREG